MSSALFWTIFVIYSLVCAFYCAEIAGQKNQHSGSWFINGLLFGLLALIAVVGLPVKGKSTP